MTPWSFSKLLADVISSMCRQAGTRPRVKAQRGLPPLIDGVPTRLARLAPAAPRPCSKTPTAIPRPLVKNPLRIRVKQLPVESAPERTTRLFESGIKKRLRAL
jgi:hypothetical protein